MADPTTTSRPSGFDHQPSAPIPVLPKRTDRRRRPTLPRTTWAGRSRHPSRYATPVATESQT